MAWPIIASTCTTLAAFVPLVLWPGMAGEFMKYLPITLIAVLSSSLFMALLFVPTLGAIFGKTGAESEEVRRNLAAAETGDLDSVTGLTGRYVQVLKHSLKRPWRNVGIVVSLLVSIYVAFGLFGGGVERFPDVEQPFGMVDIRARGDLSTDEKDALVRQVEARVLGMPELEFVYAKTGSSDQGAEDQIGTLTLNYVEWDERRSQDEILAEIRERTADLAGIMIETRKPDAGPPEGKPINIEFSSRNYELLEPTVAYVSSKISEHPGVINVENSLPLPGIEWQIRVDRAEAARFGADVALVGAMVQLVTNGIKIGEYRPDDSDEEIDIRVRYPSESRTLAQIDELRIPTDTGGLVPISTFVEREPAQKVSTINRTDRRRTVTIQADVLPDFLSTDVIRELQVMAADFDVDPRVSFAFRGSFEDQKADQDFLNRAFFMALAMMAIILVTQFNSIYQAGLILTAVLFSTGGVMLGHLIMGKPFGIIMSSVGVITLAGIVVNNNIVFIDTYNVLRSRGAEAYEAVVRTCAIRLRPVLLTTVTTIIGLMPMVLGVNINLIDREISVGAPSSQWWTQLASSVAGGLAFATVLTLFLTPSLLMIQANVADRFAERRATRKQQADPVEALPR
jgi:multidrug efflux pump